MSLTPDQARALWEAGGFVVLQGLQPGSDVGIDGMLYAVKSFAGYKFVPPGFHLVVWGAPEREQIEEIVTPGAAAAEGTDANAAASASAALASAFPLRVAYFSTFDPRERVGITLPNSDDAPTLVPVDDARLPGLDTQLAAYPFSQLDSWRALTGAVSSRVVQRVRGNVTFIDSLTGEEGGDEIGALREAMAAGRGEHVDKANEQRLQFPVFDLKRSWAEGASGDARTCWSRDKSWLLAKVCADVGGPTALLGHLQLAFVLVTHVWNFASLGAYKRILSLFSQSSAAISGDSSSDPDSDLVDLPDLQETYFALLATLTSQLCALPESAFDSELPDLDTFYLAQIGNLRANLGAALGAPKWWGSAGRLIAAWKNLQEAAMKRGWEVEDLRMGDEDSDDEEGEYAPVVVEM